jgi:membrane associated rhomboid family serine protease
VISRYGLVPIALSAGRVEGLFGHIFLHGGWLHLFLNTTALLAFGAPVARLFGSSLGGALRFSGYFLLCGVLGGLTFWALHPTGGVPLVGASGAISGLMGGAARLIERRGRLSGPFSRGALRFVIPWVVLNLLIALAGAALGPAVPIAWEAHLGGLAAGLLLLGVFAPRPGPAG